MSSVLDKLNKDRFPFVSASDVALRPHVKSRIKNIWPEEGIGAAFSPPGCGKSFAVVDMLGAIDSGRDWFGHRVKAAPCLYMAMEGAGGVPQRLRAYEIAKGKLSSNFKVMLQSLDIRIKQDRADLIAACFAANVVGGVVVIDTLNQAAAGMDENSSIDMGLVISAAKEIQFALGGLVVLVHHSGKDSSKGLRGHSSLLAALDCAIEITRDGDRRSWCVVKSKDGNDGISGDFRLSVVEVGKDEYGEPITSCVVVPEESAGAAVRRAMPPKGGNARLIWDALKDLLKANGERRPDGAPDDLPVGRPVISLENAIAGSKGRLTCDTDQRGYRARIAITSLVASGFLTLRDGWLWVS